MTEKSLRVSVRLLLPRVSGKKYSEIREAFWEVFKCQHCGGCCTEKYAFGVAISPQDIEYMAAYLGISKEAFENDHMDYRIFYVEEPLGHSSRERGEKPLTFPCPFFSEGLCSIYDRRPADCRVFPLHGCLEDPDEPGEPYLWEVDPWCPAAKEAVEQIYSVFPVSENGWVETIDRVRRRL